MVETINFKQSRHRKKKEGERKTVMEEGGEAYWTEDMGGKEEGGQL